MAKGKKSYPNTRHWKGAMLRDSVPGIMNLAWKIAFGEDKPDISERHQDSEHIQSESQNNKQTKG